MAVRGPEAYITLLVSDNYLPGAMVLGHSLRDAGTKKLLVALVTLDSVSGATIEELNTIYDQVLPVDRISNPSPANLYLMNRPDLGNSTFTKIALWRQTQFSRLVYIDADTVVLRAPEELFSRPSTFAAAPDVGWPDCFNSGMMALTPNMGDYYGLLALAARGISFDGADQGLLNMHFREWDRVSFAYNCTPSASYQYVPAYRHFQSSVNVVHFIGKDKPWVMGRNAQRGGGVYEELLGRWWAVYDKHYRYPSSVDRISSTKIVSQYVTGEDWRDTMYMFSEPTPTLMPPHLTGHNFQQPQTNQFAPQPSQPEGRLHEERIFDPPDPVERIVRGEEVPKPTVEQRRFEAPQAEWNPTVEPPPQQSRPEAANFPTEIYTFSEDRSFFQAPKAYPEPPRDMWYEVPKTPPANEKPKPIFPWEYNQAPATRVFPKEPTPSPSPPSSPNLNAGPGGVLVQTGPSTPPTTATATTSEPVSPVTPTVKVTPAHIPFSSYSRTNAWDEMPSINRYVEAYQSARRGRKRPAPLVGFARFNNNSVTSPTGDSDPIAPIPISTRRPSLKLTDFPTEADRPSLPVTPAPITRPSFWGSEREDDVGDLPTAEGVPNQSEWNPLLKLEELQRRQSEILAQGPEVRSMAKDLPNRKMPELLPAFGENDAKVGVNAEKNGGVDEDKTGVSAIIAPGASEDVATEDEIKGKGEGDVLKQAQGLTAGELAGAEVRPVE